MFATMTIAKTIWQDKKCSKFGICVKTIRKSKFKSTIFSMNIHMNFEETNFYYLNSRYYYPEIHRFIRPNSFEYIDETDFSGLNLYAYCLNNPVN